MRVQRRATPRSRTQLHPEEDPPPVEDVRQQPLDADDEKDGRARPGEGPHDRANRSSETIAADVDRDRVHPHDDEWERSPRTVSHSVLWTTLRQSARRAVDFPLKQGQ